MSQKSASRTLGQNGLRGPSGRRRAAERRGSSKRLLAQGGRARPRDGRYTAKWHSSHKPNLPIPIGRLGFSGGGQWIAGMCHLTSRFWRSAIGRRSTSLGKLAYKAGSYGHFLALLPKVSLQVQLGFLWYRSWSAYGLAKFGRILRPSGARSQVTRCRVVRPARGTARRTRRTGSLRFTPVPASIWGIFGPLPAASARR
jgi:hypothetical protein